MAASLDNETILMSTERNRYFSLNSLGRHIWESLAEPQTMADLVDGIQDKFEVDEATARRDLQEFLEVLESRNLVAPQ